MKGDILSLSLNFKNNEKRGKNLGIVAHTFNSSSQEAGAGKSL